jgi:hypothetical protein
MCAAQGCADERCYHVQAVSRAEGEALARRYKMPFFETSAKKDIGVTEVHSVLSVAPYWV